MGRLGPVLLLVTGAMAAYAWLEAALRWQELGTFPGSDVRFYLEATQRWLNGGGFYEAHELAGPFILSPLEVLYPPTTILLYIPFLYLPLVLWWLIPLAVTARVVVSYRPTAFAWGVIMLALWVPNTIALVIAGNPVIWALMAVALAVRYHWPGAFLVLKPTVAPLALLWIRNRSWWIALGGIVLVSLAFLPMWFDYVKVLANARDPRVGSVLHSIGDVPMLLIPIVAYYGRGSRGSRASSRLPNATDLGSPVAGVGP